MLLWLANDMLNEVCFLSAIIIILIFGNHLETLLHNIHCVHHAYQVRHVMHTAMRAQLCDLSFYDRQKYNSSNHSEHVDKNERGSVRALRATGEQINEHYETIRRRYDWALICINSFRRPFMFSWCSSNGIVVVICAHAHAQIQIGMANRWRSLLLSSRIV